VLPLLTFDARMATWDNERDVLALLVWRAWDSRVNGLTSAVHDEDAKLAVLDSNKKLEWLKAHGKLPLPDGQAYGTLLQRQTVERESRNLHTGELVRTLRNVIVPIANGDVINYVLQQQAEQ